jgi:hypothetical protein
MAKLDITEVESDSLLNNLMQQQEEGKIIDRDELGLSDGNNEETDLHVYIAFTDKITIKQGVETIETQVCKGNSLQVTREDKTGNAVVAIVSSKDVEAIEKLDEVSFVKIDSGVDTTATNSSKEESQEQIDTGLNKTADDTAETTQETVVVSENNFDTENKTGYGPILATVIVGVAILFGILFVKRNK